MHDEVCGSRWVVCVTSTVVLSLVHQTEDLTFTSPKIIGDKELQEVASLKTFSKFESKFSS